MDREKGLERVVLHVDMNSFFASVEQRDNPDLRGKPICVVGRGARTVITTSSYEARAFGVKTGMNIYEAKSRCPEIIVVVGNNQRYTEISSAIMEALDDFSPVVEISSIDEAYIDLTGCFRIYPGKREVGMAVKERVFKESGLHCSVGIAPNKLLAKLASDMQKPNGLTIIEEEDVASLMQKLPVGDLCGIGRKTERTLLLMGIRNCGDLAKMPVDILRSKFGIVGERLHYMALGIDHSPVVAATETPPAKSAGHSMTFPQDLTTKKEIRKQLLLLSEMVSRRVRRFDLAGQTVTVTVRFADFTTFSRQTTLADATSRTDHIHDACMDIMDGISLSQPVRLLGVRLSHLSTSKQLTLFTDDDKTQSLSSVIDHLNGRYGSGTVGLAALADEQSGSSVISPSWRPDGIRKVELNSKSGDPRKQRD